MRVGVLGLGSIGARHAGILRAFGHDVNAFDPARPGDPILTRNVIIEQSDAMVIATPTAQHYQDLLDCMAAGKPTFVEKPIVATHSEWRDLQKHKRAKRLFVGFNLRFHECVTQARGWLDDGLIGTPQWASFTCAQFNDRAAYLSDGVIRNWSHEIDLALHLLGPAKVACAAARITDGSDDIADIVLKHEGGAQSSVHLDYVTRPDVRQFIVVGSDTSIIVDLIRRQAWVRHTDGEIIDHFEATDSFDDNYVLEMRAFIDRIEGKDVPGATGEDGLAALDVCLQARKMAGLH